jgi:uncharacterized protein involved in type VI secretion and phage assembly
MNVYDLLMDPGGEGLPAMGGNGRVFGAVIALVTNNRDPEDLGRVRVRYPWLSETEESQWARVATFMAGPGRGGYFLPEVDDEVVVLFEHGDVRFPVVVGALWNGVDAAPRSNADGGNDQRVITSRSGHELVFDDAAGAERVEVRTQGGHSIVLDDASGGERVVIEARGGSNRIEIDAVSGTVTLTGQTRLRLEAQAIEIEAGTTMSLKAGATLELQGALVKIN